MSARENVAANFDRPILIMYLLLMFKWVGPTSTALPMMWTILASSTRKQGVRQTSRMDGHQPCAWRLQVFSIRGDVFRDSAYTVYGAVLLLLLAVLQPGEVNGAKAWFAIGGFGIQPAEFAKFATALALTRYLERAQGAADTRSRAISTAIILAPVALIMLQPDTGTSLVSGAFILVLYREGSSGNVLLLAILAAVLSVLSLILKESPSTCPSPMPN